MENRGQGSGISSPRFPSRGTEAGIGREGGDHKDFQHSGLIDGQTVAGGQLRGKGFRRKGVYAAAGEREILHRKIVDGGGRDHYYSVVSASCIRFADCAKMSCPPVPRLRYDDCGLAPGQGGLTMPKFVIEREIPDAGKLSSEQLRAISQTSCGVLREMGPQIQWVQSYVTARPIDSPCRMASSMLSTANRVCSSCRTDWPSSRRCSECYAPVALSGSPSGPISVRPSPLLLTLGSSRTTVFPSRTRTPTTPRPSPCRRVRSNTCSQRWVPSRTVRTVEVPLLWPEPRWAALGVTGSTYGPTVAALGRPEQDAVFAAIERQAGGDPPAIMRAVLGRAVAG